MRIAFVGKGGSGKSTFSVLFSQFLRSQSKDVLLVDADLNMHTPLLLGHGGQIPVEKHISRPQSVKTIQKFLIHNNKRIKELSQFRKTTPPSRDSKLITISNNKIVDNFTTKIEGIKVMIVGTFQDDGIGTACYHNNLSIFENILTHLIDTKEEVLVADMVAGIDSFANTLHSQFDLIVLVVEPTLKGVQVWKQFEELGLTSGVEKNVFAIGNKVRNPNDKQFLETHIPKEKILGLAIDSDYIRQVDQTGEKLDVNKVEKQVHEVIRNISDKLFSISQNFSARYKRLLELHKIYVAQESIKSRFGDLTSQIDDTFTF